jgi:hypothetical protein
MIVEPLLRESQKPTNHHSFNKRSDSFDLCSHAPWILSGARSARFPRKWNQERGVRGWLLVRFAWFWLSWDGSVSLTSHNTAIFCHTILPKILRLFGCARSRKGNPQLYEHDLPHIHRPFSYTEIDRSIVITAYSTEVENDASSCFELRL